LPHPGPEIRTGLLEGDDGRMEVHLVKGATIKITTNDEFKEKCSEKILWVDYKNIIKVYFILYYTVKC
jgi:pyruvate kinase